MRQESEAEIRIYGHGQDGGCTAIDSNDRESLHVLAKNLSGENFIGWEPEDLAKRRWALWLLDVRHLFMRQINVGESFRLIAEGHDKVTGKVGESFMEADDRDSEESLSRYVTDLLVELSVEGGAR